MGWAPSQPLHCDHITNITNMAAMQINIIQYTVLLAVVYGLEVLCNDKPLKNMHL